ncbi:MAG TPA: hypothetical protein VFF33_13730 [Ignavibacteriaceae bacterium]|nr:hypothetical protein [Ignavibacteriaceae bacterium]
MHKKNIYILLTILFCFTAFNLDVLAQQKSNALDAVENYMKWKMSHSTQKIVNPNLPNKNDLDNGLFKTTGTQEFVEGEKSYFMNGNNIKVEIYNYGGIGGGYPARSIREIGGLVWKNLPYIFQFCPIVGASVPNANDPTKRIHIITDGLYDYDGYREQSPTGERWVWKPLPGYADENQPRIASNPDYDTDKDGKPDSWPRQWYNTTLGEYVWPGYLKQGENNADLEVYWAMDDRDNKEFPYYPYLNDTTKKGLGVQIDARALQWSNSLAANTIFFVYTITNKSDKDLDSVFFGIYGDPDVGGLDNKDDNGFFIPPYGEGIENIPVYARSMVYFWDPDMIGDRGLPLGYLGCKFLESPGNPDDGIDNDGDGIIDERQDDGIDNDNDWKVETDDVGIDGIANTGDFGEGDVVPTAGQRLSDGSPNPLAPGEPNFEYTDLDESDQIGLTSFNSWSWGEERIYNDESIWTRNTPRNFGDIQQSADINFVFGSGYISLKKGETKRISMAFLFGEDRNDMLTVASTVQDIYNKNYKFLKPPELPTLTAVPDDQKVTLYWDTKAEESVDPITGKDFEGYEILRSTTPTFEDALTITDGQGSHFLYEPLKDVNGIEAKWDLVNQWKGYHPVPFQGRGLQYYIGDNTGLRHTFVDSNNVINGQTYYYALIAFDHGDSTGFPPSETTKKISVDPITGKYRFDSNTLSVVPGPRASGYITPEIKNDNLLHQSGIGNGVVDFEIVNDLNIRDANYKLTFSDTVRTPDSTYKAKNYTVEILEPITEEFYLFDTKNTEISNHNIIIDENFSIKDALTGFEYTNGTDYDIDIQRGTIKRTAASTMPNAGKFVITYRYYPIYQSTATSSEDFNPVFDGIHLQVFNNPKLEFDTTSTQSRFTNGRQTPFTFVLSPIGAKKYMYPGDYIVTFASTNIDSAVKSTSGGKLIKIPVNYKVVETSTGIDRPIVTLLNEKTKNDSAFTRGDDIVFFVPGATGVVSDTLTWALTIGLPAVGDSLPLGDGDVLILKTKRPFYTNDVFTLATKAGKVSNDLASSRLDNIYVVPNPYVAVNDLEPANRLASQNRGERRIYFENLPQVCTIRIFSLSGELVQQLDHNENMDNAREYWNLLNKDGFSVSYGIYIAHIEAPGVGEKLIKFAIIK